jgi:hypothetical protein
MPKTPKRPADMMQLAKMIGEIATGEISEEETAPTPAQVRASKGGLARAKNLSPKKRVAIARKGADASAKARKRT